MEDDNSALLSALQYLDRAGKERRNLDMQGMQGEEMKVACIYRENGWSILITAKIIKGEYIEFPELKMAFIFPLIYQQRAKSGNAIYLQVDSLLPKDKQPDDKYFMVMTIQNTPDCLVSKGKR